MERLGFKDKNEIKEYVCFPLPRHMSCEQSRIAGHIFICKVCRSHCAGIELFLLHQLRPSHIHNLQQHKKWMCEPCGFHGRSQKEWEFHCETQRHQTGGKKTAEDLYCSACKTQCRNRVEMERHKMTKKHIKTELVKNGEGECKEMSIPD
jgi:hypothetical protein